MYRQPEGERNAPRDAAAVLVDLDDTLFDQARASRMGLAAVVDLFPSLGDTPLDVLESAHGEWLDRLHLDVLRGALTVDEARRIRFERLLGEAGVRATEADLDAATAAYRRAYVQAWCAIDGAAALLERLRRDARVAIVTNNVRDEQLGKLRACRLDHLVDAVIVWEDVRVAKPDPAMFRIALDRLDARPEEGVVLGDSWSADVVGGVAAGLRAVWLNRRGAPCPDANLATEIRALVPTETVARIILKRP